MLESLKIDPPQSLLLSGQKGVGLFAIASWYAGNQVAGIIRPRDSKDTIDDENGTISVEAIRRLYDQSRARYVARQVIIIDNADRMSRGAQNAFLKLLEEPNENIHFILTAHSPQSLLPTVRSRTQHVTLQPLTKEVSDTFIETLGHIDTTKKARLQFIAEGLPAELTRLVGDESYFAARAEIITDARSFLQKDTYSKLLIIQKYKADRTKAIELIDSSIKILRRSISDHPQPAVIDQLKRLLIVKERLASNHNMPLQLAAFVV